MLGLLHNPLALFFCFILLVSTARATAGWLQVVDAGNYALNIHNENFESHPEAGWRYKEDTSNGGFLINMYERASQGMTGYGSYSVSDDFSVPAGKTTSKVMLALQGVRSFNLAKTLNPFFVIIGISHHNATHDGPDHWQPAIKWFNLTAPAGGWHNMSRDVPASNTNPTSTGLIPGAYDWFELDMSDVNGGQGLGEGHYWFTIQAKVKDYSAFEGGAWTIGNNYAIGVSLGRINLPDGGVLQGKNPGFGSAAKLPYVSSGTSMSYYILDYPESFKEKVEWKRTPTCAYDPSGACDLTALVFLWTDVTTGDANVFQGTLPPPSCTRNAVGYTISTAEPSQYKLPAYACPGKYYAYTDPATVSSNSTPASAPISGPVVKPATTPVMPVPVPTNACPPGFHLTPIALTVLLFWAVLSL